MNNFYDNFESRRKREQQKSSNGFFSHLGDAKSSQVSMHESKPKKRGRACDPEVAKRFVAAVRLSMRKTRELRLQSEALRQRLSDLHVALKLYPAMRGKNFMSSVLLFEFFDKFEAINELVEGRVFRHRVEHFSSNFFAEILQQISQGIFLFLELFVANFIGPFDSKLSLFAFLESSGQTAELTRAITNFLKNSFGFFRNYRRFQEVRSSDAYSQLLRGLFQFERLFANGLLDFNVNSRYAKTYMASFILPVVRSFQVPFATLPLEVERHGNQSPSGVQVMFQVYQKLAAKLALDAKEIEQIGLILFRILLNNESFSSLINPRNMGPDFDHHQMIWNLEVCLPSSLASPQKTIFYLNSVFYLRFLFSTSPLILEKFKKLDSISEVLTNFTKSHTEVIMIGRVLREFGHVDYNALYENLFDDKFLVEVTRASPSFAKSHSLLGYLYLIFLYSFEINRYSGFLLSNILRLSKKKDLIGHIESQLSELSKDSGHFFDSSLQIFVLADLLTFDQMTDDNMTILQKFRAGGKGLRSLYGFLERKVEYFQDLYYERECCEKAVFKKISIIMHFIIDCNSQQSVIDCKYIYNYDVLRKFRVEFVKDFYFLADLEGRFNVFKSQLSQFNNHHGSLNVTIRRNYLVEDGVAFFKDMIDGIQDPLSKVRVVFIDEHGNREEGADAGGLFKDFITEMIKVLYNPEYGLLIALQGHHDLFLNPNSRITFGDQDEDYFLILGYILAKSLQMGITLNVTFSKIFLRKLKGLPNYFKELNGFDDELFLQLKKIKTFADVSDLGLYFSMTEDFSKKEIELIPGGSSIPVTNDNVIKYTYFLANYKMNTQVKLQFAAFVRGFEKVFGVSFLKLFSEEELQKLFSGTEDAIDVVDLRDNTLLTGPPGTNQDYIEAFWRIVGSFSEEQKKMLLKFVTNIDRPPIFGEFIRLSEPAAQLPGHDCKA
jgi:hypothetical protein